MWGVVPDAAATEWGIGRRTADWLLTLARASGEPVSIAFDYSVDQALLEGVIRDCGAWEEVRPVVRPLNVALRTGTRPGVRAAEDCYRELAARGLRRHHALADALALRAAYLATAALKE